MTSLLFIGTQIFYVLLVAVSLVHYFRSRDRPRRVVALTFGAFGGFMLTPDLLALNSPIPGSAPAPRLRLAG